MNRLSIWTSEDILTAVDGRLLQGDRAAFFEGLSIDSRTVKPSDLFIALRGKTHDGHRFIDQAIEAGAKGVMIAEDHPSDLLIQKEKKKNILFAAVKDTTTALGDLARFHRNRINPKVAAVTGSNGKTSTKEMTAAVLRQCRRTLWTRGNFNNEIGLPLTLLELQPGHEWAVVEMGMNRPGEIGCLTDICLPDIGVITNIGSAHLEKLGSLKNVAQAKGELIKNIGTDKIICLNGDDLNLLNLAAQTSKETLFFGLSDKARIRAVDVKENPTGTSFTLILPDERIPIDLSTHGIFMVLNALAAASIGYLAGLPGEIIRQGLEIFKPVNGRLNLVKTKDGVNLMDDSYNANPDSMKAAISTFLFLKKDLKGFMVLGDMLELGEQASSFHREIGALAGESPIERLYIVGEYADHTAWGAEKKGMKKSSIFIGNHQSIIDSLIDQVGPDDWVLVKGSRAMEMDKIVRALTKND